MHKPAGSLLKDNLILQTHSRTQIKQRQITGQNRVLVARDAHLAEMYFIIQAAEMIPLFKQCDIQTGLAEEIRESDPHQAAADDANSHR